MIGYAISFLAGGYLIPASMHFGGIWKAERNAPDHPSAFECFMSALIGAVTWPLIQSTWIGED